MPLPSSGSNKSAAMVQESEVGCSLPENINVSVTFARDQDAEGNWLLG